MKNKVLISLIVPSLMEQFEIYIPVNERVSKIKELIINVVYDLSDDSFDKSVPYSLINVDTGDIYKDNMIIRDTDIRNSKKLLLFRNV